LHLPNTLLKFHSKTIKKETLLVEFYNVATT
jgi:hypothetical protein